MMAHEQLDRMSGNGKYMNVIVSSYQIYCWKLLGSERAKHVLEYKHWTVFLNFGTCFLLLLSSLSEKFYENACTCTLLSVPTPTKFVFAAVCFWTQAYLLLEFQTSYLDCSVWASRLNPHDIRKTVTRMFSIIIFLKEPHCIGIVYAVILFIFTRFMRTVIN